MIILGNFCNIYTKTWRKFPESKEKSHKNWDLIREAIGSESSKSKIDKLTVSDRTVDDPEQISNEFNTFFATASKNKKMSQP